MAALDERGVLQEFHTTLSVGQRRVAIDPRKVRQHPYGEFARLLAQRFGQEWLIRHDASLASSDAVAQEFDRQVAKRPNSSSAIYCYEDSALSTFRAAQRIGLRRYYELLPVIGIGLLLFVFPFKSLPNNAVLIGLIGLLFCGLIGFLPARWLGEPEWHAALRQAIPGLANTVSLQPLHSLFRIGVMLSVVLFTVWVVQWQPVDRCYCFQGLTAGIALLATVALAAGPCAFSVPGWHPSQGFGPFANRNQTGTLMALGAVLALGLFASAARRRSWSVLIWFLAFIVCLVALFFSNSRAPFCLLVLGIFLWLSRREKTPLKAVAIAAGVASLICAGGAG